MQGFQFDLAKAGQRAGVHPAQVVGDFHQRHGSRLQLPGDRDGGVLRANEREQVLARLELNPGQCAQLLAEARRELGVGVDARTHRRAALGQGLQAWLQTLQQADVGLELLRPTVEHLTHAHRHRVHQVRTPGLDVVMHLPGLALDDLHQVRQRRQQLLMQRQRRTDVDSGRNNVVAALATVDVIVGVHRLAEQAAGQRGDHFVGVHVGTGARTGLEDIHRKVLHEIAFKQALGRIDNGLALGFADLLELDVGAGRRGLGQDQRANELHGHRLAADREVIHRTLGLCAVEGVFRDLKLAHAVALNTCLVHQKVLAPVQ
ncbi:hypothetical protein D3C84_358350 [compost metagenome]